MIVTMPPFPVPAPVALTTPPMKMLPAPVRLTEPPLPCVTPLAERFELTVNVPPAEIVNLGPLPVIGDALMEFMVTFPPELTPTLLPSPISTMFTI